MEIILNGRNLDFELEGEKTLSEILIAIGKWTAEANLEVITNIRINEMEEILPKDGFKSQKPIEEIEKIELETIGVAELSIDGLIELLDYFPKFQDKIKKVIKLLDKEDEKKIKKQINNILEDLNWISALIEDIHEAMQVEEKTIFLEEKAVRTEKEVLSKLKENIKELENKGERRNLKNLLKEQLLPHLDKWLNLFPKLIECFQAMKKGLNKESILDELNKRRETLNTLTQDLVNVSVKLQTGEDVKAMELFQNDITIMEDLITTVQKTQKLFNLNYAQIKVNEKSIEEEILTLKDILKEVITAFENNDIVMLCDLLEYELSPIIENWIEILKRLEEEAKANLN